VDEELNNMKKMNVFSIIRKVPKDANVISTRWVLKHKKDSEGKIIKYKARLVAKGYSQVYGIDFKNTFSPTLKQDTLKIIIAISVQNKFQIHQMDIKAAYLNAKLDEDIYMLLPEGMNKKGYCKLNKALYGLRQSGRMWNETLNKVLLELNFNRFLSDPCVYIKRDKTNKIICLLAVYVDDIIVAGKYDQIVKTKSLIKNNFEATDVGEVDFIIGIKFEKCNDGYIIHQKKYLNEILNKFNINKYNPVSNTTPIESIELRSKKFNVTKYKQAIGSLLYLAISTRPDILFSVSKASRKSDNPTYEDWYNVLKIFRYLKGNPNYGIKFTYTNTFNFNVYVDADLGGDKETRKSTTGFVMMINSAPTSWYSKLQHCVSVSTAESEYYGIHECARHCLWYRNIFKELGLKQDVITINTDNKAAIYNCENETINPKSKHIDLRYHSVRELIKKGYINLKYIKSENNLSDGFTKYLNSTLMTRFRNNILYDLNNIKL
jgi:Zn-finger protein